MATPSSSATSPSPPMAYLQPISASQQTLPPNVSDGLERDQRKKAVEKFLARAEIAMVTRRLRAQLAYASYKATHNISHASLRDLEAQSQTKTASVGRTITAKRRVVGAPSHSNNTATGVPSSAGTGAQRRGGSNSMPPPPSVSLPRAITSSATPTFVNYHEITSSQRAKGQAPSLFTSLLSTPATKQVRTIHNPGDPPVPAPERPVRPKTRVSKISAKNESATRSSSSKGKGLNKNSKASGRRRKKTTSIDKGKEKQCPDNMDVDGEMDMKAAATLTSLFLHNRPSINASSPRSSIDGSEAGSSYAHSHFSQSSARTSSQNVPFSAVMLPSIAAEGSFRSQTPPAAMGGHKRQVSTPRAAPTDSEAANLMLFLATSPSPARTKDGKDAAAFRALGDGSNPLRSKGRVLFASSSSSNRDPSAQDSVRAASTPFGEVPSPSRGGENSFTSSISSIGADMGGSRSDISGLQSTTVATISPPSRLLPPAPFSIPNPAEGRNDGLTTTTHLSDLTGGIQSGGGHGNLAPVDFFNFHEFINASPSPSRGAGLRTDVGRKLFDGEQHLEAAVAATSAMMPPPQQDGRRLGAGKDLVSI